MATAAATLPKTKGGAFLIEERSPDGDFHSRGPHRGASRHRAHGGRVLAQGGRAEPRRHPARTSPASRVSMLRKVGRTGLDGDHDSGKIRRHGNGPGLGHGGGRAVVARRLLLRLARRALRHRHAAHPVLRHRRAEAALSAAAGQSGTAGRLLPERAARRLRCAGRQDPRRSESRRHALRPQRPEDVDHQRRRGRSVHRLRQSRRREVHGVSGGARVSRRQLRRRRKEDGHQGQLHHAPSISTTCRCRWRTCSARSGAATSSRSTF